MGIKLEDVVFSKRKQTKKGAIIKSLITIGIILIVIIATVVITISRIASSITDENLEKVRTMLAKPYEESEIVTFSVGGVDEASFKSKLEDNITSFGELYTNNKINYTNLFEDAMLKNELTLNKKDMTQLIKAWSNYTLNSNIEQTLLGFAEIVNVELSRNDRTTNIRICISVDVQNLFGSFNSGYANQVIKDFQIHFYVTSFATIDNTKSLEDCVLSSNLIVNNLSSEDNEFVLKYYLGMCKNEITLEELNGILTKYFLNAISSILNAWNASGKFSNLSFVMQPN